MVDGARFLKSVRAGRRGQLLLGAEVPVEGAVRKPRFAHERGHADAVDAMRAKQPRSDGDDLGVVLLGLAF